MLNCRKCLSLLERNPEKAFVKAEVTMTLGNVYNIVGNYDSAHIWLDKSLALFPTYCDALINQGDVYLSEKRFDKAFDVLIFALNQGFFTEKSSENRGFALLEKTIQSGSLIPQMEKALSVSRNVSVKKLFSRYLPGGASIK
jgi:tetratricopeptide (TPR) repeat protein